MMIGENPTYSPVYMQSTNKKTIFPPPSTSYFLLHSFYPPSSRSFPICYISYSLHSLQPQLYYIAVPLLPPCFTILLYFLKSNTTYTVSTTFFTRIINYYILQYTTCQHKRKKNNLIEVVNNPLFSPKGHEVRKWSEKDSVGTSAYLVVQTTGIIFTKPGIMTKIILCVT